MNILFIDDNRRVCSRFKERAEAFGHSCTTKESGLDGYNVAMKGGYDGIVVDLDLGNSPVQGNEIVRSLILNKTEAVVFIFTSDNDAKVEYDTLLDNFYNFALKRSESYCIEKPYAIDSVIKRLEERVAARRIPDTVLFYGDLTFDTVTGYVSRPGLPPVHLGPAVAMFFETLMRSPGTTFEYTDLAERIRSRERQRQDLPPLDPAAAAIYARHIARDLRKALARKHYPNFVTTIETVGYVLPKTPLCH